VLPLILTWIFTTIGAFALLWAAAFLMQSYLYEQIADRLPLRAAIGAIFLGCFYTFWVFVNTRAEFKDKYGVLQEFSPTARTESSEFTAVRQYPNSKGPDGKVREELVTFKKSGSGRNPKFVDDKNQTFRLNDSQYITSSMDVKDAKGNTARFDALLDSKGAYDQSNGRMARFIEVGGKRFVEADNPSLVFAPSTAALIGAVALNVMSYLIWIVAFWPCLRFTLGHSIAGAIGFGALMMLFIVPLLFEKNLVKPAAVDVPGVVG
jgi:hypothetical protein